MAKKTNDEDGVWRTIKGRHIFIKNGQSLEEAMAESGKFEGKTKTDVKKDNNKVKDEEPKKEDKEDKKDKDKDKAKEEPTNDLKSQVDELLGKSHTKIPNDVLGSVDDIYDDYLADQKGDKFYAIEGDKILTFDTDVNGSERYWEEEFPISDYEDANKWLNGEVEYSDYLESKKDSQESQPKTESNASGDVTSDDLDDYVNFKIEGPDGKPQYVSASWSWNDLDEEDIPDGESLEDWRGINYNIYDENGEEIDGGMLITDQDNFKAEDLCKDLIELNGYSRDNKIERLDNGDIEDVMQSSDSGKSKESPSEVPDKSYEIADKINNDFAGKDTITRDEFEEYLTGDYDDEDADIRGILGYDGWETDDTTGDLTRLSGEDSDYSSLEDDWVDLIDELKNGNISDDEFRERATKDVNMDDISIEREIQRNNGEHPIERDRDVQDLFDQLNGEGSDFMFSDPIVDSDKITTDVSVFMPGDEEDGGGLVTRELEIPRDKFETYESLEEKMRDWQSRHRYVEDWGNPDFEDEDLKSTNDTMNDSIREKANKSNSNKSNDNDDELHALYAQYLHDKQGKSWEDITSLEENTKGFNKLMREWNNTKDKQDYEREYDSEAINRYNDRIKELQKELKGNINDNERKDKQEQLDHLTNSVKELQAKHKSTNETMNDAIRQKASKKLYNDDDDDFIKEAKLLDAKDKGKITDEELFNEQAKLYGKDPEEEKERVKQNLDRLGVERPDFLKDKPTNETMNNAIRQKANKTKQVEPDLPKATEIKTQGKSNRKEVSENIQAHILDYYDSPDDFVEQMDVFNYLPNNWKRGEEIAKGGSYLVYNGDMADFLDSLKINPKGKKFDEQKAFDMYTSLIGRESAKLYDRIKKNQYNQYKKDHPLTKMTFEDFKNQKKK